MGREKKEHDRERDRSHPRCLHIVDAVMEREKENVKDEERERGGETSPRVNFGLTFSLCCPIERSHQLSETFNRNIYFSQRRKMEGNRSYVQDVC